MISPRLARLTLACLALLLIASAFASAQTQPNWRIYFKTTDTYGLNSLGPMMAGVYSSSKDGYGVDGTASDSQDGVADLSMPTTRAIVGVANGRALIRDFKSPRSPMDPQYDEYGHRKVWFLRAAGLGMASVSPTVLTIRFVSTAAGLPPQEFAWPAPDNAVITPVTYWLRMTDNRGITGAPANGTTWQIPVPATWQSTAFFSLTIPTFNISVAQNEQVLLAEGYKLEFWQQQVVPEPSSLMALACGVMGLGGMFIRRQKK